MSNATHEESVEVSDPVERLKKLKSLHAHGLITDEDYQAKRQEILDQL